MYIIVEQLIAVLSSPALVRCCFRIELFWQAECARFLTKLIQKSGVEKQIIFNFVAFNLSNFILWKFCRLRSSIFYYELNFFYSRWATLTD